MFSGKASKQIANKTRVAATFKKNASEEIQTAISKLDAVEISNSIPLELKPSISNMDASSQSLINDINESIQEIRKKLKSVAGDISIQFAFSTKNLLRTKEIIDNNLPLIDGVVKSAKKCKFKYKDMTVILINTVGAYPAINNAAMNVLTGSGYLLLSMTKNPQNSFNADDVAAVMSHEIGHYKTNQKSISLAVMLASFIGMLVVSKSSAIKQAVNSTMGYLFTIIGRLQEIQADKYAIEHGFGPQLASSLAKMYKTNPSNIITLSKKDTYTVHSTLRLRYTGIMNYSKQVKVL
jgi:hypothetical protein